MLTASAVLPFLVTAVVPFAHSFDVSYTSYIALIFWFWAGAGLALIAGWAGKRVPFFDTPAGVMGLSLAVALAAFAGPLKWYYQMEGRPLAYKKIVSEIDGLAPENQKIVMENAYDVRIVPQFYNTKKKVFFIFLETKPFKTRREAILHYLASNPDAWLLRGTRLSEPPEWADELFESKEVFSNPSYEKLMARGIFPRPSTPGEPWVLYRGLRAR
jgi:hypothetical protein